jgi:mono/diheme cytochrome c family protein
LQGAKLVALAVVATACGKTQRGGPRQPEPQLAGREHRGAHLFRKFCYQCHPGGAGGLGPSLNEKPLPQLAIRTQIREGVGAMPSFDSKWLTDDEVAAIADYVAALHDAPR